MMAHLIGLSAGIIFAIGLAISGMVDPQKVKGFLNIFGHWDYSLAFVMAGAVGFNFFAFRYLVKKKPVCANEHFLPEKKDLDKNLIIGSALFGIGWGLIGICPGPAMVNLITFDKNMLIFVGAMLTGMLMHKYTKKWVNK